MAEAARKTATYEEYLALEQEHDERLEFIDGEVVAMAGGSLAHGLLSGRMNGVISRGLGAGPCIAGSADLKLFIAAHNRATYADVTVGCGPPVRAPQDRHALTNPTVLVEVLSDATEADDRGAKFDAYATFASLREYVLVDQHEPHIHVFRRNPDDTWTLLRHAAGATVPLTSIGIRFTVDEVYAGIELEPRARRPRRLPD